jgi:hypothetical protein
MTSGTRRGDRWLAIVSPLLLRALIRDTPARARSRRPALYHLPAGAYAYLSATNQLAAEGCRARPVQTNGIWFLRRRCCAAKPYRDIIPAHGFVQDALLGFVARTGLVTLGRALKFAAWFQDDHRPLRARRRGHRLSRIGLGSTFRNGPRHGRQLDSRPPGHRHAGLHRLRHPAATRGGGRGCRCRRLHPDQPRSRRTSCSRYSSPRCVSMTANGR